jgi:hypothetical protein
MVITKEVAEKKLKDWVNASPATASGQSYKIGSRQLEPADASDIRRMIDYWQGHVERLNKPSGRIFRPITRDL